VSAEDGIRAARDAVNGSPGPAYGPNAARPELADQLSLDDLALDAQADGRTRTGDPFITRQCRPDLGSGGAAWFARRHSAFDERVIPHLFRGRSPAAQAGDGARPPPHHGFRNRMRIGGGTWLSRMAKRGCLPHARHMQADGGLRLDGYVRVSQVRGREGDSFISP
jgi:hypothetical protein